MGKEAYMGWPSFNVALREGRTAFSIEGDVTALTDLAITDTDGDVVGYIYALKECVFVPTILRIRYSVGEVPKADQAVAEEYNNSVRDTAVCNFCVIHQRFREEVSKNITVGEQPLECLQLAARGFTGETKIAEDSLRTIGINPEYVSEGEKVFRKINENKEGWKYSPSNFSSYDVVKIGMYDGWPFWIPTPAIGYIGPLNSIEIEFFYNLNEYNTRKIK